jgi:hypothetical protein
LEAGSSAIGRAGLRSTGAEFEECRLLAASSGYDEMVDRPNDGDKRQVM